MSEKSAAKKSEPRGVDVKGSEPHTETQTSHGPSRPKAASMRTTVRLKPALLKAAKKKAVEEGRTLTSLIEEGLRAILIQQLPTSTARRYPRVSKARGGPRPGVDMTRTSELLEILDAELPPEKWR